VLISSKSGIVLMGLCAQLCGGANSVPNKIPNIKIRAINDFFI
jgi:hypothetical protein